MLRRGGPQSASVSPTKGIFVALRSSVTAAGIPPASAILAEDKTERADMGGAFNVPGDINKERAPEYKVVCANAHVDRDGTDP